VCLYGSWNDVKCVILHLFKNHRGHPTGLQLPDCLATPVHIYIITITIIFLQPSLVIKYWTIETRYFLCICCFKSSHYDFKNVTLTTTCFLLLFLFFLHQYLRPVRTYAILLTKDMNTNSSRMFQMKCKYTNTIYQNLLKLLYFNKV